MGLFDIFKKAISPTNQNTRPAFQEILIPERSEPQPQVGLVKNLRHLRHILKMVFYIMLIREIRGFR